MSTQSKPQIFPVIRYNEAQTVIDWLVRAFGFDVRHAHNGATGRLMHAEVGYGASAIGVSSTEPATATNPWSGVRQGIYVCVGDPDAHHARAKAAGAGIAQLPHDTDHGSRDYSARDSGGHLWGFGTYDMAGDGDVRLVPELLYRDLPAALDELTRVFGFTRSFEVQGGSGSIVHAELAIGPSTIFAGQLRDGGWPDVQFVNVIVDDPDAHHAVAQAAGANIVMPPQDTPFGARFYAARDPEGMLWWLSTYRPTCQYENPR